MYLERIVVVGASLAGLTAAATLRNKGWDGELIVVDSNPQMPADRPPLSKQVLRGDMSGAQAQEALSSRIEGCEVDVRLGLRVAGAGFAPDDLRLKFHNDHELTCDGVVIATGSVARWPAGFLVETPESTPNEPKPVPSLSGVHVVRNLSDAEALRDDLAAGPDRLIVVGAGFIGAEVAATARGLGLEVTMIEAAPLPLNRVLGGTVGEFIAELHRDEGVDLRLGVGLDEVLGADGRAVGVRLSDGTIVDGSVVVLGLGAAPQLDWLAGSGVSADNGVVCDETLWCGPGVVAAGDCANWPNPLFGGARTRVEQWENAIEQGEAAALRLLAADEANDWGTPAAFSSVPWFWSDQYDVKLQMAGRPDASDELVVIDGDVSERRFAVAYRRGDLCTGVVAVNRPRIAVMARMRMRESLEWSHVVPS